MVDSGSYKTKNKDYALLVKTQEKEREILELAVENSFPVTAAYGISPPVWLLLQTCNQHK